MKKCFKGGIRRMFDLRRIRRGGGLDTTSDTRGLPDEEGDVEFIRVDTRIQRKEKELDRDVAELLADKSR